MSLSFLTPAAALVCVAAVVPLAALLKGNALAARVRSVLGLAPPERTSVVYDSVALASIVVLLGLAAAQPVLARTSSDRVRSDAQVLFVVDVSQSMAASSGPDAATRLDRAREAARRLRASIPDVEAGVATLTDRVLPDLLPVADRPSFDAALAESIGIEEPPPLETSVRATSFAALEDIAAGNYFRPDASKRVVVLLTDGESRPFDEARVARTLGREGISFAAVHVGDKSESIYDEDGNADSAYVPEPDSRAALDALAAATGGQAFGEHDLGGATAYLVERLGTGPTRATGGRRQEDILLAPLLAALAFVPLAFLVLGRERLGAPLARRARRLVS